MFPFAGDLRNSIVRVTDAVGETFTSDDVEWLLSQNGVFDAPAAAPVKPTGASASASGHVVRAAYTAEVRDLDAAFGGGGLSDSEGDSDFEW